MYVGILILSLRASFQTLKQFSYQLAVITVNNGQQTAPFERKLTLRVKTDKLTKKECDGDGGALAVLGRNNVCFRSVFSFSCGPREPLSAAGQSRWRAWCAVRRSAEDGRGQTGVQERGAVLLAVEGVPSPQCVSQGVKTIWKLKSAPFEAQLLRF